jgi:hypothetical protein
MSNEEPMLDAQESSLYTVSKHQQFVYLTLTQGEGGREQCAEEGVYA